MVTVQCLHISPEISRSARILPIDCKARQVPALELALRHSTFSEAPHWADSRTYDETYLVGPGVSWNGRGRGCSLREFPQQLLLSLAQRGDHHAERESNSLSNPVCHNAYRLSRS